MHDVFIISDTKKNSKENYNFFRYSDRFILQQVIDYVDTFKSTAEQYELDCLYWSVHYMLNSIYPSLMDKIIKKATMTSPETVVLVAIFVTVESVSFDTMDHYKRELSLINITEFSGDNVADCFLKIKSLCEHLDRSGYWDHNLLFGIEKFFKGCSEEYFIMWALNNSKNTMDMTQALYCDTLNI